MSTRNDLPAVSSSNFDQRVRETLQTYLGRQGDPLDRGLTLRDFLDNGILKLPDGWTLRPGAGSLPLLPGNALLDPTDLTPPPVPTGFTATAGISYFFVEHANPTYQVGGGHLRTRLYGATRAAGAPAPVFADAVEIAQFTGVIYAHPTEPATTWHLWIKWESVAGVLSPSPAGGTNGLVVTTGQNVALLLEALEGEITESQLFQDLGDRIDLIDGPVSLVGSVSARIYEETLARIAADTSLGSSITTLQNTTSTQATQITALTTRTTAAESSIVSLQNTTASQATSITGLTTRVGTAESNITNLQSTTSTQATQISSISTTLGNKIRTFVQASAPTSDASYTLALNDLWYDSDDGFKPYRWTGSAWADLTDTRLLNAGSSINTLQNTTATQATQISSLNTRTTTAESNISTLQTTTSTQATQISGLTTRVGTAETSITSLQTTTANQATSISTLNSTVSGNTTSIQTLTTTTNGLSAQYTVKVDSNGYVSGFGLASTPVNGTPFSSMIVRADSFSIGSPSGPGTVSPALPFIVRTSATTINGVSVPVGVYLTDGFIQNGTITNAKIGNAAIDDAKIANLSAAKITAGTIAADRLDANVITSKVLTVDWAKITNASVSSAQIADAAITSAKIASTIQSDNYSSGSAGWQINRAGTAEFNNITLRGKITAGTSVSTRVEVGANVTSAGHHGISLSGDNFNNCFIRREGDGAVFFNLNSGGSNALSFNTVSGILQVRGDIEATSIRANTIAVQTANIANLAVSETYVSSTSGLSTTVTINIPANASSIVVSAGLGSVFYSDPQGGSIRQPATGDVTIFGVSTAGAGAVISAVANPPAGAYVIGASRFLPFSYTLEGSLVLVVTVNKR